MTDNEIIKALEGAILNSKRYDSKVWPIEVYKLENVIDLITRQQAEIERLKKTEIEIDDFCRRLCRMRMLNGNAIASYEDLQNYIQEEKSEAVKEFAERLKKKSFPFDIESDIEVVLIKDVYNIVKEMDGEKNGL